MYAKGTYKPSKCNVQNQAKPISEIKSLFKVSENDKRIILQNIQKILNVQKLVQQTYICSMHHYYFLKCQLTYKAPHI